MILYDPAFIGKHKRKFIEGSPILFFHSLSDLGEIEYQGFLVELKRDGTGRAQLFDWMLGQLSDEGLYFTKAFLESCRFYTTDREMREACSQRKAA